ncbi:cytochrome c oxidase assembly factor Coa1 family protein [Polaribacter sp.]|uniref:cytochrome c oxidase assembly factor Coa1 family protein n=1 Tax=Polaribacter sp. TaxID=1920175 RepID=UPI003EF668E4
MEEIKQKSWFQRNWMWAVPVGGCGCGCVVIILLFIFGIGAAFFGISQAFNEATPIKYATELAFSNLEVQEALGNDLEKYGIPSGNISLNNDDGDIDFSIAIKGTKGVGSIVVRGIKTNGKWVYEDLYVFIKETQNQINLLEKVTEDF